MSTKDITGRKYKKKHGTLPESGNKEDEGRKTETRSISRRQKVSWVDVNINRVIQRDIQFLLNGIVKATDCTIDQILLSSALPTICVTTT